MQSQKKIKKGGNPNLIDCNAIAQNKKKGGNSNLIDCNAWDYLPFLFFFVIALQSFKLELSPFYI